jgi:hypothetical protein
MAGFGAKKEVAVEPGTAGRVADAKASCKFLSEQNALDNTECFSQFRTVFTIYSSTSLAL